MRVPSVNLCIICTGKPYHQFLIPFLQSARRHFCPDFHRTFYVWTDELPDFDDLNLPSTLHECDVTWQVRFRVIDHEPWPGPTLHRFRTILLEKQHLLEADYTFYCDVDMRFVEHVGDDIFSDLTAVLHPGYTQTNFVRLPHERRMQSKCCVMPMPFTRYYAGGFNGGRSATWLEMAEVLAGWIAQDESSGIIPIWHDESAMNKYLVINRPTLTLPPDYCCPENTANRVGIRKPRIIALDKNHKEVRT